jgi:hypothetical protein
MSVEDYENEDYDDASSQSSFEDEELTGGAFNTNYSHNMGRQRAVSRANATKGGFLPMALMAAPMLMNLLGGGKGGRAGRSMSSPTGSYVLPNNGPSQNVATFMGSDDPEGYGASGGFNYMNTFHPASSAFWRMKGKGGASGGFVNNMGVLQQIPMLMRMFGGASGGAKGGKIPIGLLMNVLSAFGGASGGASGGFIQYLPMLAGLLGGSSGGMAGVGSRNQIRRGGFKMPSISSLMKMGQQGYQTAQQVSPFLKPLLNQYGGKYGQQAAGLLGSIGLGKRGGVDGRKARASIVRSVMNERGVPLAEASRIVKAEGLY